MEALPNYHAFVINYLFLDARSPSAKIKPAWYRYADPALKRSQQETRELTWPQGGSSHHLMLIGRVIGARGSIPRGSRRRGILRRFDFHRKHLALKKCRLRRF